MNNWAYAVKLPRTDQEKQQSVSVTTSSAATTNPIGDTSAVVYSTVECFLVVGSSPTATVAIGQPIPANTLVPVKGLNPDTDKIAAIAASGSGTLYIRPGA